MPGLLWRSGGILSAAKERRRILTVFAQLVVDVRVSNVACRNRLPLGISNTN